MVSQPPGVETESFERAFHVISTIRAALTNLESVYKNDSLAITSLAKAIEAISAGYVKRGKLVVTGIGKSGIICRKLVAGLNSLGISACFLHPTEALHGDIGIIKPNDAILMISFSGRTPELIEILPHIPKSTSLIVLTSWTSTALCPLAQHHPKSIIVPTPVHEPENVSFSVSVPTTSSAVAMAVCDSIIFGVAHRVHTLSGRNLSEIFHKHHPGGAIGLNAAELNWRNNGNLRQNISHLTTPVSSIPIVKLSAPDCKIRALDILLTAVRAPNGWVRLNSAQFIGPRRIQTLTEPSLELSAIAVPINESPLVSSREDLVLVSGSWTLAECQQSLLRMRQGDQGKKLCRGTILATTDKDGISSVIEIEDILGDSIDEEADKRSFLRSSKL